MIPTRTALRRALLLIASIIALPDAAYLVSGKVVDWADSPVAGASVSLQNLGKSATTDSLGRFLIDESSASALPYAHIIGHTIRFSGNRISLTGAAPHAFRVRVFDPAGRQIVSHKIAQHTANGTFELFTPPPAHGVYFCSIESNGQSWVNRMTALGSKIQWNQNAVRFTSSRGFLGKHAIVAIDSVAARKDGYLTSVVAIENDTALGLTLRLYFPGAQGLHAVAVRESTINYEIEMVSAVNTLNNSSQDGFYPTGGGWCDASGATFPKVTIPTKVVIIENGLIRLLVSPDMGMRVIQATDLTLNKELFYAFNPVRGHRVWDIGGVEASWPMYEHGMHIMDTTNATKLQAGGYQIIRESDGSVALAMNMRFEFYQTQAEAAMHGRYADRPLTSTVKLSPGSSMFTISYRADNPNPTPRGDRIWNDAFFVKGTPEAEIVVPARWALHHFCNDTIDMNDFHGRPQSEWADSTPYRKRSIFALNARHPFGGVFYPDEKVNRLRIHDPSTAPAMKVYIQKGLDFIEFWGGTGVVFEEPGKFTGAYEPIQFSNSYYMTGDIGKISYANSFVTIHVDTAAHTFKLTAPVSCQVEVVDFSGSKLAQGQIGPTSGILQGSCPNNQIVVRTTANRELMRQAFPLEHPDNFDEIMEIRKSCERSYRGTGGYAQLKDNPIRDTIGSSRGYNYELEEMQNKPDVIKSYHGLKAAANLKGGETAEYLLSLARVCYRYASFDRALLMISKVTDNRNKPEADYVKGLIQWEKGNSVDFGEAGVRANYHKALIAIQGGKTADAIALLQEYLNVNSRAFRPALLLAYLKKDIASAVELARADPGSVEAAVVLKELGYAGAESILSLLSKNNKGASQIAARFAIEIKEGKWLHTQRWIPLPDYAHTNPANIK